MIAPMRERPGPTKRASECTAGAMRQVDSRLVRPVHEGVRGFQISTGVEVLSHRHATDAIHDL